MVVYLTRNLSDENTKLLQNIAENDPSTEVRFFAKKAIRILKDGGLMEPGWLETQRIDFSKFKVFSEITQIEKLQVIQGLIISDDKVDALSQLVLYLNNDQDPTVISALLTAIGKLGSEQEINLIVPYLENENSRIRASAVESLEYIDNPKCYPHIMTRFDDEDNRVRANALKAVSKLNQARAMEVIRNMLQSKMPSMIASAAFVLQYYPAEENIELLLPLLDNPNLSIKNNALRTLRKYQDKGMQKVADIFLKKSLDFLEHRKETVETLEKELDHALEINLDEDSSSKAKPVSPLRREPEPDRISKIPPISRISIKREDLTSAKPLQLSLKTPEIPDWLKSPQFKIAAMILLIFIILIYNLILFSLNDPGAVLRLHSIGLIGISQVISRFSEAFDKEDSNSKILMAGSLLKLKAAPKDSLPLLFCGLRDSDPRVRAECNNLLDKYLQQNDSLPALLFLQQSKNQADSVLSGKKISAAAETEQGRAALSKSLDNENPLIRIQALIALGKIAGSEPILLKMLSDSVPVVRLAALEALLTSSSGEIAALAVTECLIDENDEVRNSALGYLRNFNSFPPESVPRLVKALKSKNQEIQRSAALALGMTGCKSSEVIAALVNVIPDGSGQVNLNAITSLQKLGCQSTSIPELIKSLSDPNPVTCRSASETLAGLLKTPTTIPALITCLSSQDPRVRLYAAESLGNFGKKALSAYPLLLENLSSCDSDDFPKYQTALEKIGLDEPGALPYLIKALSVDGLRVRTFVIQSIGKYQKASSGAAQALADIFSTPNREIRCLILQTIGVIEPDFRIAYPLILSAFKDRSNYVRSQAEASLRNLVSTVETLPELLDALKSTDPYIRSTVVASLGFYNRNQSLAIHSLIESLKDSDTAVITNAESSLVRFGSAAVLDLIPILESSDTGEVKSALRILDRIGGLSASILPSILKKLTDPDLEIHHCCLKIIGNLRAGADTIQLLIKSLNEKDPESRRLAAIGLEKAGKDAGEAVPALTGVLTSDDPYLRQFAIKALDAITIDKVEASPIFIKALDCSDSYLREYAAAVLKKLENDQAKALQAYARGLSDGDSFVRLHSAKSLGRIGSGAMGQLSLLRQIAVNDENYNVRVAALEAANVIAASGK